MTASLNRLDGKLAPSMSSRSAEGRKQRACTEAQLNVDLIGVSSGF